MSVTNYFFDAILEIFVHELFVIPMLNHSYGSKNYL